MTKPTTKPPQPAPDDATDDVWGDLFGEMLRDDAVTGRPDEVAVPAPRKPGADPPPAAKPKQPGRRRRLR